MPDIDIDFVFGARRVIDHVVQLYGRDSVADHYVWNNGIEAAIRTSDELSNAVW